MYDQRYNFLLSPSYTWHVVFVHHATVTQPATVTHHTTAHVQQRSDDNPPRHTDITSHTDTLAPPHAAHTQFLCSSENTSTAWHVTRDLYRNYLDYFPIWFLIFVETLNGWKTIHSDSQDKSGRTCKERANWTSDHRHCYYKKCWKIRERKSTSQSKRKGVTKQHVT